MTVVSSSGWAHGFDIRGRSLVYCYSPGALALPDRGLPRRARAPVAGRPGARRAPARARSAGTAARPGAADRYLAISHAVQERIRSTYGIEADVVPAPHSMDAAQPAEVVPELGDWAEGGYLLVVSRLLPYKNVDKVVDATADGAHRLVVVGRGPEQQALAARLGSRLGASARLLSGLSDAQMRWVYAHCSMLLAPSVEDFGLTPLEAATFGKPTVALRGGGYLDTIEEGATGVFFDRSEPGRHPGGGGARRGGRLVASRAAATGCQVHRRALRRAGCAPRWTGWPAAESGRTGPDVSQNLGRS